MTGENQQFLPSALEREVESALREARVFNIGNYGWINENDADPDMIGHAMWQIDQPGFDHTAISCDSPVRRRPLEIEKRILTIGEDFCGLIEASRLSVGLALVWAPHAKQNTLNEPSYFWLHHTDAFLKLAIASDRLRDLLVVACTGDAPEVYKNANKRNRLYVTPFSDVESLLSARGLTDERLSNAFVHLAQEAEAIFVNIDRRNSIVHDVATRMARYVQNSVTALQDRFDDECTNGFKPKSTNLDDWLPRSRARAVELEEEIDLAAAELIDWYLLLIRTSNNVFQVEYWSRTLGNQ